MLTAKQIAMALVQTIHETKAEIIEGHMYARLMGQCDLETFQAGIQAAIGTGLVTCEGHVIKGTAELFSIQK